MRSNLPACLISAWEVGGTIFVHYQHKRWASCLLALVSLVYDGEMSSPSVRLGVGFARAFEHVLDRDAVSSDDDSEEDDLSPRSSSCSLLVEDWIFATHANNIGLDDEDMEGDNGLAHLDFVLVDGSAEVTQCFPEDVDASSSNGMSSNGSEREYADNCTRLSIPATEKPAHHLGSAVLRTKDPSSTTMVVEVSLPRERHLSGCYLQGQSCRARKATLHSAVGWILKIVSHQVTGGVIWEGTSRSTPSLGKFATYLGLILLDIPAWSYFTEVLVELAKRLSGHSSQSVPKRGRSQGGSNLSHHQKLPMVCDSQAHLQYHPPYPARRLLLIPLGKLREAVLLRFRHEVELVSIASIYRPDPLSSASLLRFPASGPLLYLLPYEWMMYAL
ncbi:hypothetical protein DFP72DRAFT_841683 [Ephemerocybe angulata]|uniref:Uncharacterized protein n=1 Tax=Ephemerocybe angulata TaxID=980116 RepID=A0A8H6MFQ3_9AGAR|nr:hypothetical protein DFP72DRAFT_841683 [Tulosesus angulatus]